MAHHHASKKEVVPGKLYTAKYPTNAFVTPLIKSSVVNSDILTKWWRALSLSLLHKWKDAFFIATNASDEAPTSSATMEVQETFFRTKALNFKTPAKCKCSPDEGESPAPSFLDMSTYSPFFKDDEEAPITELGHVSGVLAWLNQGVTANNKAVINLIVNYHQEHTKAGEALCAL
jgi:hypothetical protein